MRKAHMFGVVLLAAIVVGGAAWVSGQSRSGALSTQDYIDIQQLYAQYNWAIDAGDIEGYVALYTPDGSFNTFNGAEGLRTFMKGRPAGTRRHWNTNLAITPSPEGARGKVYLMLIDVGQKPPAVATAARYDDVIVKTSGGWRFKKRQTFADPAPAAQ